MFGLIMLSWFSIWCLFCLAVCFRALPNVTLVVGEIINSHQLEIVTLANLSSLTVSSIISLKWLSCVVTCIYFCILLQKVSTMLVDDHEKLPLRIKYRGLTFLSTYTLYACLEFRDMRTHCLALMPNSVHLNKAVSICRSSVIFKIFSKNKGNCWIPLTHYFFM